MGPGERFFIEYIGLQSTSEADDGREEGPSSFRTSVSLVIQTVHAVPIRSTLLQPNVLRIAFGTYDHASTSDSGNSETALCCLFCGRRCVPSLCRSFCVCLSLFSKI